VSKERLEELLCKHRQFGRKGKGATQRRGSIIIRYTSGLLPLTCVLRRGRVENYTVRTDKSQIALRRFFNDFDGLGTRSLKGMALFPLWLSNMQRPRFSSLQLWLNSRSG